MRFESVSLSEFPLSPWLSNAANWPPARMASFIWTGRVARLRHSKEDRLVTRMNELPVTGDGLSRKVLGRS